MDSEDDAGSKTDHSDAGAESTQFRSQVAPDSILPGGDTGRASDAFYGVGKSIRIRGRSPRGGLALKIAFPILLVMLLLNSGAALVMHQRIENNQFTDLKSLAGSGAYAIAVTGRHIISQRDKFLREHPDYPSQAEWRTGDHWLYRGGFVDADKWVKATGFKLDEFAPVPILEQAAKRIIFSEFTNWLDASHGESRLSAIVLVNPDGSILASNQNPLLRLDLPSLVAAPTGAPFRETGLARIFVDYLEDARPEPMMRGLARLMAEDDPGRVIGTAAVLVRTVRQQQDRQAFLLLAGALLLAQLVFMSLACWYAVRRVTSPMRRLAADMQAMAEGDYSRRSAMVEADEIGMLATAFNSMAERLRVARTNERENSRLESDLAVARSIQNNLLPPQTPRVRGLDIHTAYRPAREIGGDYFDFLPVDNRHIGLVVADASGKSIPAALVMSTTRAILRFVAPGNLSAAETLSRVNAILSVDIPRGMFVTAYYLVCDPLDNSLICASAGHTPLLVARADGEKVEQINPGGIALGFDNGPIFQRSIREQRVKLESGDRILLYTDGVVECVNPANEEYSERRLREFLRRNRNLSSHDFVGALLADLDRHRGAAEMRDDTTVVTFKVL